MFCEKCGRKVSYKKGLCDHCKHPIECEGFSKFEYEKVAVEATDATVSEAVAVADTVAVAKTDKKKSMIIMISSVAAVVMIAGAIIGGVVSSNKKTPDKDRETNNKKLENSQLQESAVVSQNDITIPEIEVTEDAKLEFKYDKEYKYTVIMKHSAEEVRERFPKDNDHPAESGEKKSPEEGQMNGTATPNPSDNPDTGAEHQNNTDNITVKEEWKYESNGTKDKNLCSEGEKLSVGAIYKIEIEYGDNKKAEAEFIVIPADESTDANKKLTIELTEPTPEELYEEYLSDKYEKVTYRLFNFDNDETDELILCVDGVKWKILKLNENKEVTEAYSFEATGLYEKNNQVWFMRNAVTAIDYGIIVVEDGKFDKIDKSEEDFKNESPKEIEGYKSLN